MPTGIILTVVSPYLHYIQTDNIYILKEKENKVACLIFSTPLGGTQANFGYFYQFPGTSEINEFERWDYVPCEGQSDGHRSKEGVSLRKSMVTLANQTVTKKRQQGPLRPLTHSESRRNPISI